MICLSLTGATLEENKVLLAENLKYIGCAELRADLLEDAVSLSNSKKCAAFAQRCIEWVQEEKQRHGEYSQKKHIQFIFTLRRKADGGAAAPEHEANRCEVLQTVFKSGVFDYVDIEGDDSALCSAMYVLMRPRPPKTVAEQKAHTHLIISRHYFDAGSAFSACADNFVPKIREELKAADEGVKNIEEAGAAGERMQRQREMRSMVWVRNAFDDKKKYPNAAIKCAVMCATSQHLRLIFQYAHIFKKNTPNSRYIFAAMGDFGRPARILSRKLGSLWTYASARGSAAAAPGHFTPEQLAKIYNYKHIQQTVKIFAVIGNPVLHSKSPEYHNPIFQKKKLNAVYIHLQLDDIAELLPLIKHMNIRGLSVTIPYKPAVIPMLTSADSGVAASGSCNTILVQKEGLAGYNTDIDGFFAPLAHMLKKLNRTLSFMSCTIIGSGGAAQAAAQALIQAGAQLLIVNRTLKTAAEFVHKLNQQHRQTRAEYGSLSGYAMIASYSDLIVQASSAGMNAPLDTPLPNYPFTGKEIAYDIVYTPRETKFLRDAAAAGCTVLYGDAMFNEQARRQSDLFCAAAQQ